MSTPIATVEEVRVVEAATLEQASVSVEALMERAALGVAAVVAPLAAPGQEVAVLAGTGHNGGDAAACARILRSWGHTPTLYLASGMPGAVVQRQLAAARAFGVPFEPLAHFESAPVVVDGLFGFGLNRAPEGEVATAIRRLNADRGRAVVAIDLPSGTLGDTGMAPGERVVATHTVATGLVKLGVACDPAVDAVGELWQADLGFLPAALAGVKGHALEFESLPERAVSSHKGTAGTVVVVGGSAAMSGAPALVAQAAYRAGAGLVVVCVPAAIRDVVALQVPEALVVPLPERDGRVGLEAFEALAPWLLRASSVAIGPGLGRGEGPSVLVGRLWEHWDGPLLVDADGLMPELSSLRRPSSKGHPQAPAASFGGVEVGEGAYLVGKFAGRAPTVLTPHPKEAGRLLGRGADSVQADRLAAARELAQRFGAISVLKGARTLVSGPDGTFGALLRTTVALATAGSGDVLSGLITGLLAQGLPASSAAERGVALHAELGLRAASRSRAGGLLARDLLQYSGNFRKVFPEPAQAGSPAIRLAR